MEKKQLIAIARYGSIAAVFIQLGIITFVASRTKFDLFGSDPISNLGTTNLFSLYAIAFVLGGLALAIFLGYLQVTYRPGKWFVGVMLVGIIGETLTGIVPDNLSNSNVQLENLTRLHVHGFAATCLFISIPLAMMLFTKTANEPRAARQSSYYFWAYVITFIPAIILIRLHILYAISELTSLLIFDAWILHIGQFLPASPKLPTSDSLAPR